MHILLTRDKVDIATGALSLSSAKNSVIVGDIKQLPNVVEEKMGSKKKVILCRKKIGVDKK
ncbi:hypothetical protein [Sedimentibacter sp.]|uniref:hypothetical protein n=1 Tax=Sedimentibacter sp. TaxID=1960295 RepID=UPI002899ED5D|nr:hypothetical protein [Sedimentibacter sp.]